MVGVQGEVSVQKDIYKTVEVLKAKIKQDKKGKINIQYRPVHAISSVFVRQIKRVVECRKLPNIGRYPTVLKKVLHYWYPQN